MNKKTEELMTLVKELENAVYHIAASEGALSTAEVYKARAILRAALTDALKPEDALYMRRYRWLREQNWDVALLCVVMRPKQAVKLGHHCPSLGDLDAAIDAAMKEPNA
jgi:hypothetical protein